MLAAVLHDFADLRVEKVPSPAPGPDECLLRVRRVQPSVTEAMLAAGHDVALHDHLAARLGHGPFPFGGHEFVADLVDPAAARAAGLPTGTRVVAAETVACASCRACRSGRHDACAAPTYLGFTRPGAFAEEVAVPTRNLLVVPDEVSDAEAAAVQPLVGALHAHAVADVAPGASVLVIGTGVMGLLAVQVARAGNAGLVVAVGRTEAKLALARRLGADHALLADGVEEAAAELTAGAGFDVVVETAGGEAAAGLAGGATVGTAARLAARGGRVVVVSVLPSGASLPLGTLREKGLALLHPRSGRTERGVDLFAHALRLVARGDVDLASMLTHELDGLASLPDALRMTTDKRRYGVLNPPQLRLVAETRGPAGPERSPAALGPTGPTGVER